MQGVCGGFGTRRPSNQEAFCKRPRGGRSAFYYFDDSFTSTRCLYLSPSQLNPKPKHFYLLLMRVVRNTTRACSMLHPASHAGRGDTLEESCCRTCRRLRTSGSVRRPLNRACGSRAPARAHTHAQRASERARRERGEGGGERNCERAM
jgi:hypothetical protein